MLEAAVGFRRNDRDTWDALELEGHLTIVDHHMMPWMNLVPTAGFHHIDCPLPGGVCYRCTIGKSGLTFRWFSVLWKDEYMRRQEPMSWKPGDEEGVWPGIEYGPRFTGDLIDAFGEQAIPLTARTVADMTLAEVLALPDDWAFA